LEAAIGFLGLLDMGGSMIGTNHDLESIQRVLDCRILELKQLASAAPDQAWVSGQLATLGRERITVSAILVHRRIEAAKKIVDLAGGLLETAHSPAALLRERGRPDPAEPFLWHQQHWLDGCGV
jgi:hypothetical protein